MTESQKRLFWHLGHPRDFLFRLLHILEADPICTKIPDLRDLVLSLPERYANRYQDELKFIESIPCDRLRGCPFPYPRVKPENVISSGWDNENGLPYVIHSGRRLYFPSSFSENQAKDTYRTVYEVEGITGQGCLSKSPHCYQSVDFGVEDGDIVLDVGCAEALFALDVVERAKHVYLFESAPQWKPALEASFRPFSDKTTLVAKYVGGETTRNTIQLSDAVPRTESDTYFVKMDIEGAERVVLESSRDFLMRNRVKLACCVYHRQDDEQYVCALLREYGYSISFSNGYMLPTMNGIHHPYFRRCVVYARNYN